LVENRRRRNASGHNSQQSNLLIRRGSAQSLEALSISRFSFIHSTNRQTNQPTKRNEEEEEKKEGEHGNFIVLPNLDGDKFS
jgi:hypothetical protein